MATGTLISDKSWHSSPTFNYSVSYETQRPNKYSKTVRVKFTVTVRSIHSSCSFGYPIYFSNTIDNQFRTITNSFGNGVKSISYTSDWIEFSNSGTSLIVGITPKCGDVGHTSYDTGTIYFDSYQEPQVNITSFTVKNISGSDGLTKVKFEWTADVACDFAWYSKDNGANWSILTNTNIVSGLSPNTSYNFKLRVRRSDNQLTTDSSTVKKSTYDIARISNLSNFEHGNNPILSTTNPAGISSLNTIMKIGNTQILNRTVKAGINTITFSDTELDNLYKKYGTGSSLTATFTISGGGYSNSKTCTVTLKGNQKTVKANVGVVWKRGKMWTNVNGIWKRAIMWTNVNGTWKRGI